MSNSSALCIHITDLQQGMKVFPCNRKGEPLEQTQVGKPCMVYRALYAPNSRQLALYPSGSSHIDILMSRGVNPEKWIWFAPAESFSPKEFPEDPKDPRDTRVVVFLNEGLVRNPVHPEDVLELLVRTNGNGTKVLAKTGEDYSLPEGAILIPTGKIG